MVELNYFVKTKNGEGTFEGNKHYAVVRSAKGDYGLVLAGLLEGKNEDELSSIIGYSEHRTPEFRVLGLFHNINRKGKKRLVSAVRDLNLGEEIDLEKILN